MSNKKVKRASGYSKVVQIGLDKIRDTKFHLNDRGGFEVREAYIFWTNFRGEADRFGNPTRNFNLAVSPEMGKILLERGWRVREYDLMDSDDSIIGTLYFINVKINMNTINPPIISLYSEFRGVRNKQALDISTVGELDRVDIQTCDLIVNAYESPQFPGKITGYLYKLNAIQEPNTEFGGKYEDWLEADIDCLSDGTCSLDDDFDESL